MGTCNCYPGDNCGNAHQKRQLHLLLLLVRIKATGGHFGESILRLEIDEDVGGAGEEREQEADGARVEVEWLRVDFRRDAHLFYL